jgi:hypothetical protein
MSGWKHSTRSTDVGCGDDLVIATAHGGLDEARDHMHHLMKATRAWAAENGVKLCDGKSKALVIGEHLAASTFHIPLAHRQARHLV